MYIFFCTDALIAVYLLCLFGRRFSLTVASHLSRTSIARARTRAHTRGPCGPQTHLLYFSRSWWFVFFSSSSSFADLVSLSSIICLFECILFAYLNSHNAHDVCQGSWQPTQISLHSAFMHNFPCSKIKNKPNKKNIVYQITIERKLESNQSSENLHFLNRQKSVDNSIKSKGFFFKKESKFKYI